MTGFAKALARVAVLSSSPARPLVRVPRFKVTYDVARGAVLTCDILDHEETETGADVPLSDVQWWGASKLVHNVGELPYVAGDLVAEVLTKVLERP